MCIRDSRRTAGQLRQGVATRVREGRHTFIGQPRQGTLRTAPRRAASQTQGSAGEGEAGRPVAAASCQAAA
eukprot:5914404-Prymnesium_polylepis.1